MKARPEGDSECPGWHPGNCRALGTPKMNMPAFCSFRSANAGVFMIARTAIKEGKISQTVHSWASAASFLRGQSQGQRRGDFPESKLVSRKGPFLLASSVSPTMMRKMRTEQPWPHCASLRSANQNEISASWEPLSMDQGRQEANKRQETWGQGVQSVNKHIL